MGSFSRRNQAMHFDRVFRSCNMEGSTIIFLLRRRNGLIFKAERGHFTQNPGGFDNNSSFKEEERVHFQGGTRPLILEAIKIRNVYIEDLLFLKRERGLEQTNEKKNEQMNE